MKKRILFLFLLFVISSVAKAQEEKLIISLKEQRFQYHLGGYKILRIIDARKDKSNIGFTVNGLYKDVRHYITFSTLLEREFANLVDIDTFPITDRKQLILRINEISIQELTKKKWARINLSVSFIEKKDDKYIELFTATEVKLYNILLADRAVRHAEAITETFKQGMANFTARSSKSKLRQQEILIEKLFEAPEADSIKFSTLENHKPCIFHNFNDYRDNMPDTSSDFSIKYTKVDTKNKVEATFTSKEIDTKPWGFYNGKHIFLKNKNKYYPLQKANQDWIFYEKQYEIKKMSEDALIIEAGFALVLAAATGTFAFGYLIILEDKEVALSLNKQNGSLDVYKDTIPNQKTTSLNIFNYAFSENKDLEVFVNGEKVSNLPKNSYSIVELDKFVANAQVCVQAKGENRVCENIPLIEGKRNYILAKIKKNKPITIEYELDKSDLNDLKNGAAIGVYDLINFY